jgi:uncharacterized coiled-coil protein SlyX
VDDLLLDEVTSGEPISEESSLSLETEELDLLRDLLIGHYREQMNEIEAKLADLETNTTDQDALIDTLTPVLGELIRNNIRTNREEMIEALYPLIGGLVVRAVSEAIQDLARNVDERMRRSFNLQSLWRQVKAQMGGVSQAEAVLRSALPFEASEIFLIHLESGLPIWYASSRVDDASADSDLIGSMLTAIRDFVADAFGRGQAGDLERIEYGDQQILIESTKHIYIAVVFLGIEPPGYREMLRSRLIEIEYRHGRHLRRYNGDASLLEATALEHFQPLLSLSASKMAGQSKPDGAENLWLWIGVVAVLAMLLIAAWIRYGGR